MSHLCVVQHSLLGGFLVIDVKLKVWSLIIQWVRRFVSSLASWVSFMAFWFHSCLDLSPLEVFSQPFSVVICDLPPFYHSLVLASRPVDGSFSAARSSLVMASGHAFITASMSANLAMFIYCLRITLLPTVFSSSPLHLVTSTGPPPGNTFLFSIWIVLSLICHGKSLTVSSILLLVCFR